MDKEILIMNIKAACKAANIAPTKAFAEAGVGKDLFVHLRNGQVPSVSRIADLAAFLGVSTSDLVGDAAAPAELAPLAAAWAELNDEGRARLVEYAEDLVAGGRFAQKNNPVCTGREEGAVG